MWGRQVRFAEYPIAIHDVKIHYDSEGIHARIAELHWHLVYGERTRVVLRVLIGVCISIWLVLVLIGKGGFVHLLLLNAVGLAAVELLAVYRPRMTR